LDLDNFENVLKGDDIQKQNIIYKVTYELLRSGHHIEAFKFLGEMEESWFACILTGC